MHRRQEAGAWEAGSRLAVVSRLPSAVAFPLPPAASSLLPGPPQPLRLAGHADQAVVICRRQVWEPQVEWLARHRSSRPRDARALYIVPSRQAAEHLRGAGAPRALGLAPVPGPPRGWRRRETACVRARERAGALSLPRWEPSFLYSQVGKLRPDECPSPSTVPQQGPRRGPLLTSLGFMERASGGSSEYCWAQHPRHACC
ncbi:protein tyrosine phosphatase type IVA 3 isoform X1 [Lutra lutra]|uniref:protein tyrosine phosphatase type IVA 3 isoform X1 n=1 Tax=Lutra lutra TaxID=9657 RepID=UPI001FCFDE3C|nr:protein tyrosine phosphatase type IVA 3 isoform X1 [Lutra lutra]